MAKSRVPSPKEHLSITRFDPVKVGKRTLKVGDAVLLRATVTRTNPGAVPSITVMVDGYGIPITASAPRLLGED